MKHLITFAITLSVLTLFTTCKKDKESPDNYRLTKTVQTLFNEITETLLTYDNNRLRHVSSLNGIVESELIYQDDSITINYNFYEDNEWRQTAKTVHYYVGSLISKEIVYGMPSNIIHHIKNYEYEGSKIVSIKVWANNNDSLSLYDSTIYTYEFDNLVRVSFSYKAFPNEDLIENIKHEFTYQDNKLYEEFVYGDYHGYPIQLLTKKVYFYNDDERISLIKHYEFRDDTYSLSVEEEWQYDDIGNLISKIQTDNTGKIVVEEFLSYELGTYNYQSMYDIRLGGETKIPLP